MPTSFYELLREMDAQNIVIAYNGTVDEKLLDAVYSVMDKHLGENKSTTDKKKKLFHILVESLQNVFRHTPESISAGGEAGKTGFVIKYLNDVYSIITGNNVLTDSVSGLKEKLEKVNNLSPADLRTFFQESLAKTEFSERGGAGLGIIEMARKSGNKLKYEFTRVNEQYSFFMLEVTI